MDLQAVLNISTARLQTLQVETGLFRASSASVITGYDKSWIRDTIYEAMGLEAAGDINGAIGAYHGLLDVMIKFRYKIEYAAQNKPLYAWQYIHARVHPETLEEFYEFWGNKQNDSIGLFLLRIASLIMRGIDVLRHPIDWEIIELLVRYLNSVEYWHDPDNGMWEEGEEIHSSSIGNCVAGLRDISNYISVPLELIDKGQCALNALLPRESLLKHADLAQLSLIWPCNVVTEEQRLIILHNIETFLLRDHGVIRYDGDTYYGTNKGEAEWCFGLPWLAIIYKDDPIKYSYYLDRSLAILTKKLDMPELYYAKSRKRNENTPLGWGTALLICAIQAQK